MYARGHDAAQQSRRSVPTHNQVGKDVSLVRGTRRIRPHALECVRPTITHHRLIGAGSAARPRLRRFFRMRTLWLVATLYSMAAPARLARYMSRRH
jgi:hypothetical protein